MPSDFTKGLSADEIAVSLGYADAAAMVAAIAAGGSAILNGAGAPDNGDGNNGDYYLRTSNGDFYQKAAGAWGSPLVNLTGPAGATGATGSNGADGADGVVPDAGTTGGTSTDYTATLASRPEPLAAGYSFIVVFNATNGSAPTIALSSGTAQALRANGAAPPASSIIAGVPYLCRSDGTYVHLVGQIAITAAQLGSGTPDSTTYLRGDRTWATPSGASYAGCSLGVASNQPFVSGAEENIEWTEQIIAPTSGLSHSTGTLPDEITCNGTKKRTITANVGIDPSYGNWAIYTLAIYINNVKVKEISNGGYGTIIDPVYLHVSHTQEVADTHKIEVSIYSSAGAGDVMGKSSSCYRATLEIEEH